MASDELNEPAEQPSEPWQRLQAYFVTVEWHDDPHQPESPERVAQALRHMIEHGHHHGPETPPSRFTVRVKADEVVSEVTGTVAHHHHHTNP